MLMIGRSNNSRCSKGTKSLVMWYKANKKTCVTQQLFEDYAQRLDQKFAFAFHRQLHGAWTHIQSAANQAGILPTKMEKYPSTSGPGCHTEL